MCVGICCDCRMVIVLDIKIMVIEVCSLSIVGIVKGIENVFLVSYFSDSM